MTSPTVKEIQRLRRLVRDPPPPSSEAVQRTMAGNRRRDSKPELRLRSALHRAGFRFRVDLPIRAPDQRPIRPDVVFTRARVVVFVDGCFWHGCPDHGTRPRTNSAYWAAKIGINEARDRRQTIALEQAGWIVVRIWEHEDPEAAVVLVAGALKAQAASGSGALANKGSSAAATA